ncbi:YjeF N-terminal domain-like protein [Pleurostoma richardsiae]|uniref:Enhancer of mRNA-decapping protein 3 n=1 Tax=Pleurostoma richardsiae TaxID=41990 RepID=A0AA38RPU4_9PEZI|nr:YjeF N-terminal domain-like protein [Pleurostoma richardsiae]
MASQFIGLQMLVTLRDPPVKLRGTVAKVEAGQSLTLVNVFTLGTPQWRPNVLINAANVVDLSEVPAEPAPATVPAATPPIAPPTVVQPTPPPAKAPFVDPAILSVGKPPVAPSGRGSQPRASERRDPQPTVIPAARAEEGSRDVTPTATTLGAVKDLKIENREPTRSIDVAEEYIEPEVPVQDSQSTAQRKRPRRKQRGGRNAPQEEAADPSPAGGANPPNRGTGWRQTPILQDTASFQPFKSLKKNGGKGRNQQANDNGWASEDVTDVQGAGDFDFEGSLAKFDKRTLFDQMRKEDQISDADRLVSHNRQTRPKPGTAGGKNLHYSENVLDLPTPPSKPDKAPPNDFWNSEADDGALNGGERLSGRELGSRQSSRRGESKTSVNRRSQSRKASAVIMGQGPSRTNSGQLPTAAASQGFYLVPSSRRLETVSALQMLNLENIAHNELGLTEDMMTENAGRGIAEVTLTALTDPAIKVRLGAADASKSAPNAPAPTVVILAGNNKSGIRAVAAGRHLRNKGANVLLCIVGIERGDRDLLEDMRQQVRLFKNFGGRVYTKTDLFDHVRKASIPVISMDAPRSVLPQTPPAVTLIIDALLGLAVSFDELRTGDQATVYELIEWANRNEAFVLAVDIPTGIDPSSGKVNIIDGNRLYVRPRYVVAMGAPKKGLLEAIAAGDAADDETVTGEATISDDDAPLDWKLFVADMGLGAAVWKKAGTKIRRGIDFDDKWVLEMKYQSPSAGGD